MKIPRTTKTQGKTNSALRLPRGTVVVWRAAAALLIAALLLPLSAAAGKRALVALGDSITYGYGLADRTSQPYPALVAEYYGMSLKNCAVNGYTARDIKKQLDADAEVSAAVKSADAVCVTAGGNELLDALFDTVQAGLPAGVSIDSASVFQVFASAVRTLTSEENAAKLKEALRREIDRFSEGFPALISEIRAKNPSALIITQTLYNPFLAMPRFAYAYLTDYAVYFDEINRIILSAPADITVRTDALFESAPGRYVNAAGYDIHPTKTGHRAIARLMIRALSGHSPYDRVYRINMQSGFRKSLRISCEVI